MRHDARGDLQARKPGWFTLSARLLPVGILGQFMLAGTALFRDGSAWGAHAALGGALAIPVGALLAGAVLVARLRDFGWWAGLVALLYLLQVALAAVGTALPLSFHPFNAGLLLTASLVLLAKFERHITGAAEVAEMPSHV
jgi:hypothetical protein